jgi:hypothetical protein
VVYLQSLIRTCTSNLNFYFYFIHYLQGSSLRSSCLCFGKIHYIIGFCGYCVLVKAFNESICVHSFWSFQNIWVKIKFTLASCLVVWCISPSPYFWRKWDLKSWSLFCYVIVFAINCDILFVCKSLLAIPLSSHFKNVWQVSVFFMDHCLVNFTHFCS